MVCEYDIRRTAVKREIPRGDRWFEIELSAFIYLGKQCGYQIIARDITETKSIMALADVFDALATKRSYKEAFDFDTIHKIITEEMGKQFDPSLEECFLACEPQMVAYYMKVREQTSA